MLVKEKVPLKGAVAKTWNFANVVKFLIHREEWTHEHAHRTAREYRRWIQLTATYPELIIPSSKVVDEFWHAHIMFTKDYASFCDEVFGYFLHHVPLLSKGEVDEALVPYNENTIALYRLHFGEPDVNFWTPQSQICWGSGGGGNSRCDTAR